MSHSSTDKKPFSHFPRWVGVVGVLLAIGGAWLWGFRQGRQPATPAPVRSTIRAGGYQYINPLLLCDSRRVDQSKESQALQKSVQYFIDEQKNVQHMERMSVFVRDLSTGHWMGINENDLYAPASLLKVSVLIAVLQEVQENPSFLTQRFVYNATDATSQSDDPEFFKPSQPLQQGVSYTVEELLHRMITESSNEAYGVLNAHIDQKQIEEFYRLLSIQLPQRNPGADFLSPNQYSQIFRVLYNGTYLSRSLSEKALTLLTQTQFMDGLVKGIPDTVLVAHKFGERGIVSRTTSVPDKRQLHECGIVYAPDHPYFICVMTQGTSFPDLADVIAGTSKIVYDAIGTSGF